MGITIEEEQAQITAQERGRERERPQKKRQENHAEAAKAAQKNTSENTSSKKAETTQGEAVSAGADDLTLLAAIIECEAGGESYECQLAVGAAVINRVKSRTHIQTASQVLFTRKASLDRHHQESSQESLAEAFLLHATVQHRRQCPEWTTQEDAHPSMTTAQQYK